MLTHRSGGCKLQLVTASAKARSTRASIRSVFAKIPASLLHGIRTALKKIQAASPGCGFDVTSSRDNIDVEGGHQKGAHDC